LKIGITGGTGYIGSKLATELVRLGHEVRIIDNLAYSQKTGLQGLDVELIQADILDEESQARFIDGLDFVYHLLAISHPGQCSNNPRKAIELNVYVAHALLDKVKGNGIQGFLFPSAIAAIYGEPQYVPVDENHPVNPTNVYGIQKRAAELFCQFYYQMHQVPTVIVRQSHVFGWSPGMKFNSVVHIFLKKALGGEDLTIQGSGNQVRNFIHIDDLIDAYICVLNRSIEGKDIFGEIYNIGGEAVSIKELAHTVADLSIEKFSRVLDINFEPGREEIESKSLILSTEKAKKTIGFHPQYTLRQRLEQTLDSIIESYQRKER
jgi:UDP-glucose 4-epimerase